jgi:ABC-type glycerol-3-phosphate transport system substrate-binding protein
MRRSWIAAILLVAVALAACSSGKKSGSTPPPSSPGTTASTAPSFDSAAAEAQIKTNWAAFFSKETPLAKKLDYLQRGSTMQAAVEQFGKDPRTSQASAKITGVFVTSPSVATVNYQVLLGGRVALPSAVGTAVYEDGAWKVSDTTFCGLLALAGGAKPAGC